MLVITRRPGERVQIGDDVSVMVVKIRGGAVRLGIDAPEHIKILREGVPDRDQAVSAALQEARDRAKQF